MVRRCWVNFQCWGVLLLWIIVGQGPIALAVGAGGCWLDIFLSSITFFLSPSLWETARYGLIYCLKGPLSPKQPAYTCIVIPVYPFYSNLFPVSEFMFQPIVKRQIKFRLIYPKNRILRYLMKIVSNKKSQITFMLVLLWFLYISITCHFIGNLLATVALE